MRQFIHNFKKFPLHNKLLTIGIVVVALCFTVYLFVTFRPFFSNAATAQLSFSPSTGRIPPNATVGVNVNSGASHIAFARVEITFDRTKLNLASEPTVSGPLKAVIGMTNRAGANSSGRIIAVLALCNSVDIPCSPAPAGPLGSFELLRLSFQSVTTAQTSATLNFDVGASQLVDTAQAVASLTGSAATFQLNSSGVTGTPTRTPTPTPTRSTTGSPTRTPTPTRAPTPTPRNSTITPTKTPTRPPTNTPTRIPSVSATPTNSLALPGDINADGTVDIVDYALLFANIGKLTSDPGVDPRCDLIQDGSINILDYSILYENFGRTQ